MPEARLLGHFCGCWAFSGVPSREPISGQDRRFGARDPLADDLLERLAEDVHPLIDLLVGDDERDEHPEDVTE